MLLCLTLTKVPLLIFLFRRFEVVYRTLQKIHSLVTIDCVIFCLQSDNFILVRPFPWRLKCFLDPHKSGQKKEMSFHVIFIGFLCVATFVNIWPSVPFFCWLFLNSWWSLTFIPKAITLVSTNYLFLPVLQSLVPGLMVAKKNCYIHNHIVHRLIAVLLDNCLSRCLWQVPPVVALAAH